MRPGVALLLEVEDLIAAAWQRDLITWEQTVQADEWLIKGTPEEVDEMRARLLKLLEGLT